MAPSGIHSQGGGGGELTCHDFGHGRAAGVPGSHPIHILGKVKLEWGCPNGTKYPPQQPIPNRAILPNRARLQTVGQTDRRSG